MNIIFTSEFRHKNNRKCIKSSYFKNIRLKCTFFLTKKGYNFFILNIIKKNFPKLSKNAKYAILCFQ